MPFTFDATPAGANANSWATTAEGDDYFGGRRLASAWIALTTPEKQVALADGTHDLEQFEFDGSLPTTTQRLRVPRSGLVDADGRALDYGIIPRVFKEALFEHVLFKLNQGRDTQQPTGLEGFESVSVPGAIDITTRPGAAAPTYAKKALAMLAPYILSMPGVTRLARSA